MSASSAFIYTAAGAIFSDVSLLYDTAYEFKNIQEPVVMSRYKNTALTQVLFFLAGIQLTPFIELSSSPSDLPMSCPEY